jgi:hypothetical protein
MIDHAKHLDWRPSAEGEAPVEAAPGRYLAIARSVAVRRSAWTSAISTYVRGAAGRAEDAQ